MIIFWHWSDRSKSGVVGWNSRMDGFDYARVEGSQFG